jgi:hypothetical protein
MRAARKNKCSPGDVRDAFEAYCRGLERVEYGYGDSTSLFNREPGRHQPDCHGRAKGFLQILAVCGVPLENLALVCLDGGTEGKMKVLARDEAGASFSPNAVKASLGIGATEVKVSRTRREPFANHYCAKVSHGGIEYWDPLFNRGYVNGMKDYFQTLKEEPSFRLPYHGPKCYVDTDDQTKRLYLFKSDDVLRTVADSDAYKQVLAAISKMADGSNSVYLIIDSNDWANTRAGEKHPAILKHVFKPAYFTETLKR